jgi:SAM-dependent methyltransferase
VTGQLPVLDMCCGTRMFWFRRDDPRVLCVDNRREDHEVADSSMSGGVRRFSIDPDVLADFTRLPFGDGSFDLVVFDPPHFRSNGSTGWLGKKYGTLPDDWASLPRRGFSEGFRVLRPRGVLVLKWCSAEVPVASVLACAGASPLFGNRQSRNAGTHWIVFIKE